MGKVTFKCSMCGDFHHSRDEENEMPSFICKDKKNSFDYTERRRVLDELKENLSRQDIEILYNDLCLNAFELYSSLYDWYLYKTPNDLQSVTQGMNKLKTTLETINKKVS